MNRVARIVWSSAGVAILAHLLLLFDTPHLLQGIAVLVLAGLLPGALLVTALVGYSSAPPTRSPTRA